jgi:hypothetical protein
MRTKDFAKLMGSSLQLFVAKAEKGKDIPRLEINFIIPVISLLLALLLCS